jgi:hypothetical protein
MNQKAVTDLQSSSDPSDVFQAALDLARSSDAADLAALQDFLLAEGSFLRLDTARDYQQTTAALSLSGVMQTLSENKAPAAAQVLLKLTNSAAYNAHSLRKILLIHALAPIRPSPPAAITYWDSLAQPNRPFMSDVAEALCVNQSDPAMALLERKFSDPNIRPADKIDWMRQSILTRRNDEPLLKCCERLLTAGQPKDAAVELVEVLFDYQPTKWYRGCDVPQPPIRAAAGAPAKEVLRRLADHALNKMTLPPDLKAKVQATQELLKSGG